MTEKKSKKNILESGLFAPFLFSLYPVLQLIAINVDELLLQDIWRSLLFSVLLGGVGLGFAILVMRKPVEASLFISLVLLFFYIFGDLSDLLQEKAGLGYARADLLILLGMVFLLAGWFFLIRRLKNLYQVHFYFNLVAFFLFLSSSAQLVGNLFQHGIFPFSAQIEKAEIIQNSENLPDIYYIILDGYGREDILRELYQFDNSAFINELEEMGFYVAEASNSNYIQTLLSTSSSLNMDYVQNLAIEGEPVVNRQGLIEVVQHSAVRRELAAAGYWMVSFRNGYKATAPDAEIYYDDAGKGIFSPLNSFESIVANHSMLRILLHWKAAQSFLVEMPYKTHREQVLSTFARLKEIPSMEGNYFVYAHIISPHPPFLFDQNGEIVKRQEVFSLFDANYYLRTHPLDDYLQSYINQLQYINILTLESITEILARSEPPPIIIIQGDHGPGAFLHWGSLEKSIPEERFGILNAYYFPSQEYDTLYPDISPVNSFRVVLNTVLGHNYVLLNDQEYYSKWSFPFEFEEVQLPE